VTFRDSRGDRLAVTHRGAALPTVERNGQKLDWGQFPAYRSTNFNNPEKPLITQAWDGGTMRAIAGPDSYDGSLVK
jgi:hypothetical protein